jgi:hypothetical protein
VLIGNNTLQNCFPGSQTGEGILLTPRIGLGNPVQTFSVVSDTTITGNTIQAGVGISVSGMDNYCVSPMPCIFSSRTVISNNTLNVSVAPNGVPGSYGWCLQIDEPRGLSVTGMNCTTDGTQSVFVDTYPCVACSIGTSVFNADFGGQGIVGPSAFFASASGKAATGNSISAVTVSGITAETFQAEWAPLCGNCILQ